MTESKVSEQKSFSDEIKETLREVFTEFYLNERKKSDSALPIILLKDGAKFPINNLGEDFDES